MYSANEVEYEKRDGYGKYAVAECLNSPGLFRLLRCLFSRALLLHARFPKEY